MSKGDSLLGNPIHQAAASGGGNLTQDNFLALEKVSGICLDAIKTQHESIVSGFQKISEAGKIANATIDSLNLPFRAACSGIDEIMRATEVFPSVNLPDLQVIRQETSISENDYQEILDKKLKEVSPELVIFRRGCWKTFNDKEEDYIRQSSSSMRGLVDTLLRLISPMKEVEETDYFKNNPNAKTKNGKPTRKTRIYYAVNFDAKKANSIERIVRSLLEAYDNLSAWDHNPTNDDQFVHGTFIVIEGCLLSLLCEVKK